MSAEEKQVSSGTLGKLDIVNIRNDPASFFQNEDAIKRLKGSSLDEQKVFVVSLVAEATPEQLNNINKESSQILGGMAAPKLNVLIYKGTMARRDFTAMSQSDKAAEYLLGSAEIDDVKFNVDLHHKFEGLVAFIPADQRVALAESLYGSCRDDTQLSQVAKSLANTFGAGFSRKFQRLIALNKEQNLADEANPATMLASKAFNPDLALEFPQTFTNQLGDDVGGFFAKMDFSELDDAAITRLLNNLNPLKTGEPTVAAVVGPLYKMVTGKLEQMQQESKAEEAKLKTSAAAMPQNGLFAQMPQDKASTDAKAPKGPEDNTDIKNSCSDFKTPCAIL